uniref:NADH-ubiquinone oxidoreductase chain 5 n=1 Tax=Peltodytes quadratus TaxID=1050041 RepID=S4SUF5_9COLE|nr:NADH dehydrogenase subunit 5 [Peltodytes quadratus]
MSICFISFVFLLFLSVFLLLISINFIIMDLTLFIEYELMSFNSSSIVFSILLDWMSLMFMSFVLFISSMVIFYSDEYMYGDLNLDRFIILVLLFVFSMMMLIISPNLISILLGWDGLGLVSYCLVIYYQNIKSYNAGMITALMNRVGDVMLLIAITWMFNYGSWNFIYYFSFMQEDFSMQMVSLLVLIAAMTKSAQIPFSSWLPAAMAAPTPVSALVHSSTLVTAGVYLMIRFSELLMNYLYMYLLLISVLTMFMSGLVANYEYDLKKIIALSTLSQLGLMMSILSLGNYKLAFFHLLTHALFKALLFMCAGNIIHNMKDNQDIRYMGNLIIYMPMTCICMNISNLALCGMPFLAGFYSKDLILELVLMSNINLIIFILFFISTGLTVCYSMRLCYYSITGDFNFFSYYLLNDKNFKMLKSMICMVIFVILMGSILSWLIFPTPMMICLPLDMKLLTLMVSIIGAWLGYVLSNVSFSWMSKYLIFYKFSYFFGCMWFMYNISTFSMNYLPLMYGNKILKNFDQGWNEYFGGQGMYLNLKKNSSFIQFFQYNNIKIFLLLYILFMMILSIMFMV